MPAVVQIAGQEDPELTGRKIAAVPANQRSDGLAQEADLSVGDRIGTNCHVENSIHQRSP